MKGFGFQRLVTEFNGKWLIVFLLLEIVLLVGKDYQGNRSDQEYLKTPPIREYELMNTQENQRRYMNTTDILKKQSNVTTRIKATNAKKKLPKENTQKSIEARRDKQTAEDMLHLREYQIDLCPRKFPKLDRKAPRINDDLLPSIEYIASGSDLVICESYKKISTEDARRFCRELENFQKEHNLTSYWSLHKYDRIRLSSLMLNKMGYEQRVPNLIGLGVKKCGSSAMLKLLGLHPQINSCHGEGAFFGKEERYPKGLDYYRSRSLFSKEGDITFEKTPAYFQNSDVVPNQMKVTLPDSTKFYFSVRDPVERVISDFRHSRAVELKKASNKTGFTSESEGVLFVDRLFDENGNIITDNPIIDVSNYARHLKKYLQYFPVSRFHIEDAYEIREKPIDVLQRMEKFLGIDDFFLKEMLVDAPSDEFGTCLHINNKDECTRFFCQTHPKPYVNETILKKLRDYFRPFNKEFETITGQKFSWTLL